jgi:hypothetical protein
VKLGAENRKEVIALSVLVVIALITTGRMLWPSPAPIAPPTVSQATSSGTNRSTARRGSGKRASKTTEARLDPTLDLDLLRQSEQIKYAGNARNIFVAGSIPVAHDSGATDRRKQQKVAYVPPTPPPPPPINLKFYGFASKPGEPKKIFLSQGEDIFIAAEGDIVNRRYRVLRISPSSVDIEDVMNNNRQSIPLTLG